MQELSVALTGQKMPAGNRYVVRVNEMKKYFSWDKVPGSNRIIITDIFPEPVTKPRKKCKKRIATPREYYPQGKYNSMIYANLTTLELNHKYSLSELFEELGMTSCRFTRPKYYLDCVNTTNLIYTNLTYEDEEGLDAYDALVSSGLLDKIIEMIGVDYGDIVAMFEETLSARISFTNSMSNRLSALFGILENVFKEATPEQLDYLRKLADVKDGDNSTVKKAD